MHFCQFMLKLTLGRWWWQRVKQIRQLDPAAHDLISRTVAHLLPHKETILGVKKGAQCIRSTD